MCKSIQWWGKLIFVIAIDVIHMNYINKINNMGKLLSEITIRDKIKLTRDIAFHWKDIAESCAIDPEYIMKDCTKKMPIDLSERLIEELSHKRYTCSDLYHTLYSLRLNSIALKYSNVFAMSCSQSNTKSKNTLDQIIGISYNEDEFGGYLSYGIKSKHLIEYLQYEHPNALDTPMILLCSNLLGYKIIDNHISEDIIESLVRDPLMTVFIVNTLNDNDLGVGFIKPCIIFDDELISAYKEIITKASQDKVFGIKNYLEFKKFLNRENDTFCKFLKDNYLISGEIYDRMTDGNTFISYDMCMELSDYNLILLEFFHRYPHITCISPATLPKHIHII